MIKFKGCQRCGGDTFVDQDLEGFYQETCLQCGERRDYLKSTAESPKPKARDKEKAFQKTSA
ncbi:MAG: hypothetical protein WC749_14965 [Dehalococcoidia bacterium]